MIFHGIFGQDQWSLGVWATSVGCGIFFPLNPFFSFLGISNRVTTCLENLEMSGNLKHVREMSGMLLTVREMSGKKSCHGKVSQNCNCELDSLIIYIKTSTTGML